MREDLHKRQQLHSIHDYSPCLLGMLLPDKARLQSACGSPAGPRVRLAMILRAAGWEYVFQLGRKTCSNAGHPSGVRLV